MSDHHSEDFLCSICYATKDVMKVTTICGHDLCINCTSKLVKKECPYCRTPFPSSTELPNAHCKSCIGPMHDIDKCCKNAKCIMCLMSDINENIFGLEERRNNTHTCDFCKKEYYNNVQKLLNDKIKSLLKVKQQCLSMTKSDTYNHSQTLSYMSYDLAYDGTLKMENHFK